MLTTLNLFGQLDHPGTIQSAVPDFGSVSGSWGHLQYSRPFGIDGIIMDSWQDLTTINPISGGILNTDRQGWLPLDRELSLWSKIHPALTSPADTTAATLLVNYKQGDADFNDFTLWYHNSLGESTRYGWTSKLRSHQRFIAVTQYDEQRHRLQLESELKHHSLRLEMGYTHLINPLYMFELDTLLDWDYNDALQVNSDRWDGSLHWKSYDSLIVGSELFAWVQGGLWDWAGGEERSLSALAFWGTSVRLWDWEPMQFKFGGRSNQVGGYLRSKYFLEMMLPGYKTPHVSVDLGMRNLGNSKWLPVADAQFKYGPFQLQYQTRNMVFERSWSPEYRVSNVHHFQTRISTEWVSLNTGGWQADQDSGMSKGLHTELRFTFPWMMQFEIGASNLSETQDWVWTREQYHWQFDQEFFLFDKALFGHLKLWGRHVKEPQLGNLDPETLSIASSSAINNISYNHQLNYTISGQVSTVIFAFSDSNIMQDGIWSQYVDTSWESQFTSMENQSPASRFRYLSLIWIFDN
jgi:hypothetical protein